MALKQMYQPPTTSHPTLNDHVLRHQQYAKRHDWKNRLKADKRPKIPTRRAVRKESILEHKASVILTIEFWNNRL